MSYSRSPALLSADSSRLLIVDMQEKLLPVIPDASQIVPICQRLLTVAEVLDVPVSCTEQYPQGLGPTVAALSARLSERFPKLRFSCAECLPWANDGHSLAERSQVVLAGIETHVCVLQTTLDLLAAGFSVFVVVDATSSRKTSDRDLALRRMSDSGATLVSSEMVLFEWCEVAGTDKFKQISKLLK